MTKADLPSIAELPDEQVLCRRGGLLHRWDPNPMARLENSLLARASSFVVPERCERCGKEKFIYLDENRQRLAPPYYRNPPGWVRTQRASAAEVEQEIFGRSLLLQRIDPDTGEIERPSRRKAVKAPARKRPARKAS